MVPSWCNVQSPSWNVFKLREEHFFPPIARNPLPNQPLQKVILSSFAERDVLDNPGAGFVDVLEEGASGEVKRHPFKGEGCVGGRRFVPSERPPRMCLSERKSGKNSSFFRYPDVSCHSFPPPFFGPPRAFFPLRADGFFFFSPSLREGPAIPPPILLISPHFFSVKPCSFLHNLIPGLLNKHDP